MHTFFQADKIAEIFNPNYSHEDKDGFQRPDSISLVGMDGSEVDALVDDDFDKLVQGVYHDIPQPTTVEEILKVKFDEKYIHEMDGESSFILRRLMARSNK